MNSARRVKKWRAVNPEKNFEQNEKQRIRRKNDPEVRAKKRATDKAWREKNKPKRIIIEEIP